VDKYHNFIGIDIGKFNFVVALHGKKEEPKEYENTSEGHDKFIKENKRALKNGLCILETTGGQELALLLILCEKGYAVHRANTRKVKNFIRSFGNTAKTDKLDAKALALYGLERGNRLSLFVPSSENAMVLFELAQRRNDLRQMLVAEKNRKQAPRTSFTQESIKKLIVVIEEEISEITSRINEIVNADENLKIRKEVLTEIPGIGDIISNQLIAMMPELGTISKKQAASLAGLAPRSNDSGIYSGYRSTGYGREGIKPLLFLAAMAARNSNSYFKAYYENLIARGKKKMVALVALMRKLLVVANSRIRDRLREMESVS
jgi:transposase